MRVAGKLRRGALLALGALVQHGAAEATACNGNPGLCDLRVDQVTWAGTHNADATGLRLNGMPMACVTDNHEHHMVWEMEHGLRFFDTDVCFTGNEELYICHGPAMGILFKPEMENVKKWLDDNPNEIIVLSYVNANAASTEAKYKMMIKQSNVTEEVFGDMLVVPEMEGGKLTGRWPKLGDLVKTNKRVIVLWGKALYYHVFKHDQKVGGGFRNKHIWFEKYWAMTYGSMYHTLMPAGLEDRLEHFCDDVTDKKTFNKEQPMILVDAYLTISAKRPSFSYCNLDLAGDVNPQLLEEEELEKNPLVVMQKNCWAKGKQVSMISMDFPMYFPLQLDRLGQRLNELNVARYGSLHGKMKVKGDMTTADAKKLLIKMCGDGCEERIKVEGADDEKVATERRLDDGRRLASNEIKFSVKAPDDEPLKAKSNTDIIAAMREAAKSEADVDSLGAVCPDPGQAQKATRSPAAAQEFVEGSSVTFTCNTGLVAHGSLKRTCRADGIFSGVQPRCDEAWTAQTRLMPPWVKILLIVLSILAFLLCIGGLVFLCIRRRGYKKLDESQ